MQNEISNSQTIKKYRTGRHEGKVLFLKRYKTLLDESVSLLRNLHGFLWVVQFIRKTGFRRVSNLIQMSRFPEVETRREKGKE
jgi:hypothetical protein